METETINFSYNWNNKLQSDCFTTIRLSSTKYQKGSKYVVMLGKEKLKEVEIIEIKPLLLNQINEFIARVDTGYSREECIELIKKMYSKSPIDWNTKQIYLILCKTLK